MFLKKFQSLIGISQILITNSPFDSIRRVDVSIPNRDFTNFDLVILRQNRHPSLVSIPNRDFTNFDPAIKYVVENENGFNP